MAGLQYLVILGLDSEKKAHAARFNITDEAAVQKAAGTKGFQIGVAKTEEAASIASKLIEGKIFDSGRGLVPFVSNEVYSKLIKVLEIKGVTPPVDSGPAKSGTSAARQIPDPWAAIKVGSIILCRDPEPGPDRSWWECVVVEISPKDPSALTVRWQKYPALKPFRVKRGVVALTQK